jgi:hypothetical protein
MSAVRIMGNALSQELRARGIGHISRSECETIIGSVIGRASAAVLRESLSAQPRACTSLSERNAADRLSFASAIKG